MGYSYIYEMLHLLLLRSKKNPKNFTSLFNESDSLIAYNYSYKINHFTHLSDSFRVIMGFNSKKFLINGNFSEQLIHPQDQMVFKNYFGSLPGNLKKKQNNKAAPLFISTKCRARHLKGFWKYLLFFSEIYWDEKHNCFNKIGIIIDEHRNRNYQVVDGGKGYTLICDFSAYEMDHGISTDAVFKKVNISYRENEILKMIGHGLIAKEIAERLSISTNTVITHRKNLINKMQVKNTAELIRRASYLMLI